MKCVLITGASGRIGRQLVYVLVQEGFKVIAGTRSPESLKESGVEVFYLDVCNPNTFKELPAGIDVVVHTAAAKQNQTKESNSIATLLSVNAQGTFNVAKYVQEMGIRKMIYCSTLSVYSPLQKLPITENGLTYPTNNMDSYYGISKLTGELFLEQTRCQKSFCAITLRLGRVYGPGENANSLFCEWREKAEKNQEIVVYGSGQRSLDFIYIEDVLRGLLLAIESDWEGGILNLASGVETTWRVLAEVFVEVFCNHKKPVLIRYVEQGNRSRCYLDTAKIKEVFGFFPHFSLKEGLRAWCQSAY